VHVAGRVVMIDRERKNKCDTCREGVNHHPN
jgi:hypothetical protein